MDTPTAQLFALRRFFKSQAVRLRSPQAFRLRSEDGDLRDFAKIASVAPQGLSRDYVSESFRI